MPFDKIFPIIILLFLANVMAWCFILSEINPEGTQLYFLDVGQGDSEMVKLGGASFLIDTGENLKIVNNLEKISPFYKRRIDVVFLSHGQMDHAGGMFYLLNNFDVGLVVYNGDPTPLWDNLKKLLSDKNVPYIILSAGDKITYKDGSFEILWPLKVNSKSETNDNSMVTMFREGNFSSLFTADISSKTEEKILSKSIKADILKVPHHGSKYSSSQKFISAVDPQVAIIEVGKNSYGHPTKEALSRIIESGAKIFRTDLDGIIKIAVNNDVFKIFRIAN